MDRLRRLPSRRQITSSYVKCDGGIYVIPNGMCNAPGNTDLTKLPPKRGPGNQAVKKMD